MRTLREKCVGFIFNRTHYFNPKSLKIFMKNFDYKELYKKSYYSELDILENYMNYNDPYDRKINLVKSNLFDKKSINLLNKVINSQDMGYKFLAIFKKYEKK